MRGWHFRTCKNCGKPFYTKAKSHAPKGGFCPECMICPDRSTAMTLEQFKKFKLEQEKIEEERLEKYYCP